MYLPSELNIARLSNMYNKEVQPALQVKKSYFRRIFVRNFNAGFGSPRTDVCSTCLEFGEGIKRCKDDSEKSELETKLAIHKKSAKAFYDLLRDDDPDTITLSFDCQKNLPNPKVPDQEAL